MAKCPTTKPRPEDAIAFHSEKALYCAALTCDEKLSANTKCFALDLLRYIDAWLFHLHGDVVVVASSPEDLAARMAYHEMSTRAALRDLCARAILTPMHCGWRFNVSYLDGSSTYGRADSRVKHVDRKAIKRTRLIEDD